MHVDIVQSIARSSKARVLDVPFALGVWVGTIGGAALSVDANPNTTPPAAGRIVRISSKRGSICAKGLLGTAGPFPFSILCGVIAASSITLQPWFYDDSRALWIPFGPPLTITPTGAASNLATASMHGIGAKVFVQITANTNVKAIGYDCT